MALKDYLHKHILPSMFNLLTFCVPNIYSILIQGNFNYKSILSSKSKWINKITNSIF